MFISIYSLKFILFFYWILNIFTLDTLQVEIPLEQINKEPNEFLSFKSTHLYNGIARFSQNITTEKGNCNFENGTYRKLAAIGPKLFAESIACGLCLEASNERGKIIAGVVDLCNGCDPTDILLDRTTFSTLADPEQGAVPIRWQPIPCRARGTIRYSFMKGSNAWWFSIGIRNAVAPVKSMELFKDGEWLQVKKEYYNYFTISMPGPGPFKLRLTSFFNEILIEEDIPLLDGNSFRGKVQFKMRDESIQQDDLS